MSLSSQTRNAVHSQFVIPLVSAVGDTRNGSEELQVARHFLELLLAEKEERGIRVADIAVPIDRLVHRLAPGDVDKKLKRHLRASPYLPSP